MSDDAILAELKAIREELAKLRADMEGDLHRRMAVAYMSTQVGMSHAFKWAVREFQSVEDEPCP